MFFPPLFYFQGVRLKTIGILGAIMISFGRIALKSMVSLRLLSGFFK